MKTNLIRSKLLSDIPADWAIIAEPDRAMDLHLRLLSDAASEELRGVASGRELVSRKLIPKCI